MAPVGHNLAQASDADVRAISIYVASMFAQQPGDRPKQADEVIARVTKAKQEIAPPASGDQGGPSSAMFTGACAGCHPETGTSGSARGLNLALITAVNGPDPRNAVRTILGGVHSFERERAPFMPSFATIFTDRQVADLVVYIRWRFTMQPPWRDVEDRVHEIRADGEKS
jgi:mono/diheme cytochrome c family protein